jgi:hypothetical protein
LKEKALDDAMWRAGFGRSFGFVIRQTAIRMNDAYILHILIISTAVKTNHA